MYNHLCVLFASTILACSCCHKNNIVNDPSSFSQIIPLDITNDSIFLYNQKEAEQTIYNFYLQLNEIDSLSQDLSIKMAVSKLKSEQTFRQFISLTELYLINPYSPVRNENLYVRCIDYIFNSQYLQKADIDKYHEQKRIISMNQIGTKANNFEVYTPNKTTMYNIGVNAYKILLFYDDSCEDCVNTIDWFSKNSLINTLVKEKKIIILAISNNKTPIHVIPDSWIKCYSEDYDEYYNIIAIPSIYFLSPTNFVIFKDLVNIDELIQSLSAI